MGVGNLVYLFVLVVVWVCVSWGWIWVYCFLVFLYLVLVILKLVYCVGRISSGCCGVSWWWCWRLGVWLWCSCDVLVWGRLVFWIIGVVLLLVVDWWFICDILDCVVRLYVDVVWCGCFWFLVKWECFCSWFWFCILVVW